MEPSAIVLEPSAKVTLNFLSEVERAQVMGEIDRIAEGPFQSDALLGNKTLMSPEVVLLPGRDRLRILYTVKPDHTVIIHTILNQDLADWYFRKPAAVG